MAFASWARRKHVDIRSRSVGFHNLALSNECLEETNTGFPKGISRGQGQGASDNITECFYFVSPSRGLCINRWARHGHEKFMKSYLFTCFITKGSSTQQIG